MRIKNESSDIVIYKVVRFE